jgi:hypothetical protein
MSEEQGELLRVGRGVRKGSKVLCVGFFFFYSLVVRALGFCVGLRAWDFPTERVLPWTPLIIRTVDQKGLTCEVKAGACTERRV